MTKTELTAEIAKLYETETDYSTIQRKENKLIDDYRAANTDSAKVQAAIDANNAANSEAHYFGD